jgi:hypothetical protein
VQLNLPIIEQLAPCKNILIAGMGGGFDIFCGLPIYFTLRDLGKQVHLANYSFSLLTGLESSAYVTENCVGVHADLSSWYHYFPELYLSQWFREVRHEEIPIWSFKKTGVRPLMESYEALVDRLSIDAILLIDGGVDSLLRGDESMNGTLLEDTISLCAVHALQTPKTRILICLGFGAELDMAYAQVLENIATLAKTEAFLGSCSLLKEMDCYKQYEDALLYVQNKPRQEPSVINASVVSAVRGEYGNYHLTEKTRGSKLWISPLMSIYWCFHLRSVARRNLLLPELRYSDTVTEAYRNMLSAMSTIAKRKEHPHTLR